MCDTFVSTPSSTGDGTLIFGKNSDREPNEAQVVEYRRPAVFQKGQKLKCTYISIPQARETFGVLLCRPFWMWGAEMGANEKGVVIGNEAVFTKMPLEKHAKLTGMDLLRLALERSSTAEDALDTIVGLLCDHGQGGICGYQNKKFAYHNSFLICDPRAAWVLETAGNLWAAVKVRGFYSISNGLTIGEAFDRAHPQLIDTALKKGWLKKGRTFHFARCYSDWLYTRASGSRRRRAASWKMLKANDGSFGVANAFEILRNHHPQFEGPDDFWINSSVCMHAGNAITRNGQTAGSLVAHLNQKQPVFWTPATSSPCTGIYKPVWLEGEVLPALGPPPTGQYNPESCWWQHEELQRELLKDFSRLEVYRRQRDETENGFLQQAYSTESGHRFGITKRAFEKSRAAARRWLLEVRARPPAGKTGFIFRQYWKKQNRDAGLQL